MSIKGRKPDDSLLSLSANAPQLSNYYTPSEDQKITRIYNCSRGAIAASVVGY